MSTAIDEKVDLDVDLDVPIPCYRNDCSAEATWRIVNKPCSHSWTSCERHQLLNAAYIARVQAASAEGVCYGCDAVVVDMVMVPL